MLYVIQLVLIISVMIETNCQTSSTKDIFAPIEVNTPEPLAASYKPAIEGPKIYCDSPGPIVNGWIDTTENLPLKMSPVGRSIIYRCNEKTKQTGASSATCDENGRWSSTPPDCLSPCIVPVVEYSVVRNESSGATVSHGGGLTFKCIDSYQPTHGLATSNCNNGTWNVIPRCEPEPTCESLIYLLGLKLVDTDEPELRNVTYDGVVLIGERYKVGTKALIYCERAENITHPTANAYNFTAVCQSNGTWHGVFIPICELLAGPVRLSTIIIIPVCLAIMFLATLASVCKKYKYFNRTSPNANNRANEQNSNDAQGMRAEQTDSSI